MLDQAQIEDFKDGSKGEIAPKTEEDSGMTTKHTTGPWRWEFNREHKTLHLVGGLSQYDLTIMGFDRWGMSGAVATLRDPAEDGMNIMQRLCDRPDWIAPFPGREHHAAWCADVTHPDMRLMAAAPDLLEALKWMVLRTEEGGYPDGKCLEEARAAIANATGE